MADSEADGLLIVRAIIETKKKRLIIQKRRPHLLVEELQIANDQVIQLYLCILG